MDAIEGEVGYALLTALSREPDRAERVVDEVTVRFGTEPARVKRVLEELIHRKLLRDISKAVGAGAIYKLTREGEDVLEDLVAERFAVAVRSTTGVVETWNRSSMEG